MSDTIYKLLIETEADLKGVTEVQKGLVALQKEQKKSTTSAATAQIKQLGKVKELEKLGGPKNTHKLVAERAKLLAIEKKLTDEAKKQIDISKKLAVANRLAQRTTFTGGLRKSLGMRQPGDPPGPNWRSRLGSAVGGGLRTGVGLAAGGLTALMMAPVAAIGAQYQAYASFSRGAAGLSHMGAGMPLARRGGLRGGFGLGGDLQNLGDRGAALGYMPEESVAALQAMSRATGSSSAMGNTDLAMGTSRLTGQSIDEITNFMAEQRRGAGGSGTQQHREFQQVLQAGVTAGMDASTLPEYMEGIQGILQSANQRGGSNSAAQIAGILAMAQRSGVAGLSGARGAAALTGADAGLRNSGNIDLGTNQFFNSLALQEAGLGRGQTYTGAAGRLQRGLFQQGGIGVVGFRHIIQNARSAGLQGTDLTQGMVGQGYAQTQDQAQEIVDLLDAQGSDAQLQEMLQRTTDSELDVQHEIADHTAEIAALLGSADHGGAAGAAYTAMQNVHMGADVAGPLDELQRIMREFIDGPMHDLISDVLQQLPGVLRSVTTSISEVAAAVHRMLHPDETTASISELGSMMATNATAASVVAQWRDYQASPEEETPEQLRALLERAQASADQFTRLNNNPVIGMSGAADTGTLLIQRTMQELNDTLARQVIAARPIPLGTVNGQPAPVVLADIAYQGLAPATPRGTVSATGIGQ